MGKGERGFGFFWKKGEILKNKYTPLPNGLAGEMEREKDEKRI